MCLVQQDNITVLCDVHEEHTAADRNCQKGEKRCHNHYCVRRRRCGPISILLQQRSDFKRISQQFSITLHCGAVLGRRKILLQRNNDLHPASLHVWQFRQ